MLVKMLPPFRNAEDEILICEVRDGDFIARRKRMGFVENNKQTLMLDGARFDPLQFGWPGYEAEVEGAGFQAGKLGAGEPVDRLDRYLGILLAKGLKDLREFAADCHVGIADHEMAAFPKLRFARLIDRTGDAGKRASASVEEYAAGMCEADTPVVAVKQTNADLRFQVRDGAAQGGWAMFSRSAARRKCNSSATP